MDPERVTALLESERLEAERLRFLETTRGPAEALAFARQTRTGYRRAVLARAAPAGDADFRLRLLASYCYLKRYITAAEANPRTSR